MLIKSLANIAVHELLRITLLINTMDGIQPTYNVHELLRITLLINSSRKY